MMLSFPKTSGDLALSHTLGDVKAVGDGLDWNSVDYSTRTGPTHQRAAGLTYIQVQAHVRGVHTYSHTYTQRDVEG